MSKRKNKKEYETPVLAWLKQEERGRIKWVPLTTWEEVLLFRTKAKIKKQYQEEFIKRVSDYERRE